MSQNTTVMLKDIPTEIRIGGLSKADYKKIETINDMINESEDIDQIFDVRTDYVPKGQEAKFEEFTKVLSENPNKTYFFVLRQAENNFSLAGTAFHVPETGRNLAIGTLYKDGIGQEDIFNLSMVQTTGQIEPLYGQYPVQDAKINFYQYIKEPILEEYERN